MEISDLNKNSVRGYNVFERLFLLSIKKEFNHIIEFYYNNNFEGGFIIKNIDLFRTLIIEEYNIFNEYKTFLRDVGVHGFHVDIGTNLDNSIIFCHRLSLKNIFLMIMNFGYTRPTIKFKNLIKDNNNFIKQEINRIENELDEKIENARFLLEFSVSKT